MSIKNIDFDYWRALLETDPERFFSERRALIDASIATVNSEGREKLQALQLNLDNRRSIEPSPLHTCAQLMEDLAGNLHLINHQIGLLYQVLIKPPLCDQGQTRQLN